MKLRSIVIPTPIVFLGIPVLIGALIADTWWHGALAGGAVGIAALAAVMWWVFKDFRM